MSGAPEPQAAPAVLMVRPARFGSNAETLATNSFQCGVPPAGPATPTADTVAARGRAEHDALASTLAAAGVRVHVFEGDAAAEAPDELFPNNWLSLHADGTAVLYPMQAPSRRRERRADVLTSLADEHDYRIARVVDLTALEARGQFLEGTGSVVLDRVARVAYACLSPRTDPTALAELARVLDYETVTFAAADRDGRTIYHTNVLLALGTRFAALCTAAIGDRAERARVIERIEASGRELVDLDFAQLHAFAGNLLELDAGGRAVIALSARAHASLRPAQLATLAAHGDLLIVDVATIETYGGGSVRCMLAEVPLPRA